MPRPEAPLQSISVIARKDTEAQMAAYSVPQKSKLENERRIQPPHPAFPSEARANHARCGQALRQVFGLTGFLLAPASQFMAEPVLRVERSFLLTAAGQFRIYTGFPFQPDLTIKRRKVV
jgi:hypothetical protein